MAVIRVTSNLPMDGVYSRILKAVMPESPFRSAVFLDRDGVIIEDTHYLHRVESVAIVPGALEAVARMNRLGFPIVLVTNQSGIGRGYYGWSDFELVQAHIESKLAAVGGWFDGVWASPYNPDGVTDHRASYYRKPNPGMLTEAADKLRLDLSRSWVIGDKQCDIEAGINAGLHAAVHVLTGYGRECRAEVRRLTRANHSCCQIHCCGEMKDVLPLIEARSS